MLIWLGAQKLPATFVIPWVIWSHFKPVCEDYDCYRCTRQGHIAKIVSIWNRTGRRWLILPSETLIATDIQRVTVIQNLQVQRSQSSPTGATEKLISLESQPGAAAAASGYSSKKHRAPLCVENNAKKMRMAMSRFESSPNTRSLVKKCKPWKKLKSTAERIFWEI